MQDGGGRGEATSRQMVPSKLHPRQSALLHWAPTNTALVMLLSAAPIRQSTQRRRPGGTFKSLLGSGRNFQVPPEGRKVLLSTSAGAAPAGKSNL